MPADVQTHEDYQIGIICALALEKAAVEAMLDEQHPKLKKKEQDLNDYTLGRIGPHNVVVACLPAGLMGNGPAATVASNMQRSFPIKFGLMVGVGGGVWSKKDKIHLGDVVVSQPDGTHGGVVQWDFGKTEKGGEFRRTGSLNKPPMALLHALQSMKTEHLKEGDKIPESLSLMFKNKPFMKKRFGYQGSENDQLFDATYDHEGGETCDECDVTKVVARLPVRDDSNPEIHYGNIASGNQVMKHGVTRDRIAKAEKVICFEMEAAGLMDNFPCLVIRGICDYADSHKNKIWQPYAAATAAAVARELLRFVDEQEVVRNTRLHNRHYHVPRNASSHFTGREDILKRLKDCLLPHPKEGRTNTHPKERKFVLYGLGGSGKTQVCLKFAEDNRESFWGVFWVDASSDETAKQSLAKIAKIGGLNGTFEEGRDWLSNIEEDWLLIIDNADDPSLDISKYVPSGNRGCVLITTRNPYHADAGPYYEFKGMELEDSILLLLKTAGENTSNRECIAQAELIAKKLGCLALALIQAGATIRQNFSRLDTYLDDYSRIHKELMISHPVQGTDGYEHTVYTTWEISRKMIESLMSEASTDAVSVLDISSFLHPEDIPERIFSEMPTRQDRSAIRRALELLPFSSPIAPTALTGLGLIRIRKALSLLSKFSLVSIGKDKDSFSMHRLVHSWTRYRLNERDQRWCAESAATVLQNSIQWQWEAADYLFRRRLVPHIDFYLHNDNPKSKSFISGFLDVHQAQMAAKFALVYSENGKFDQAEDLYTRALDGMGEARKKGHLDALRIINNLALVFRSQGRYDAAAETIQRALDTRQKTLGREHPDTLESVGSLALILESQGQYNAAEKMNRQALEGREKALGKEHPKTIESISNLASVLQSQGKYDAAAEMIKRAVCGREKTLGKEHPDTLDTISSLALILQSQGKYDAAEEMNRQVLEIQEKKLGKEHPDTLTSVSKLALVLLKQGKHKAAEAKNREALAKRVNALGPLHPDTLTSISNLAIVLYNQGEYKEAEEMNRKALNGYEKTLGHQHPYTLASVINLAETLRNQQKYDEAEDMSRRALNGNREHLGSHHPNTLASITNLAVVLQDRGKESEAEEMHREAIKGYEEELGPLHPGTLACVRNVAWMLQSQGKFEAAEALNRRALEGYKSTLGPEHPETLTSVFHLAYLLHTQKQYTTAFALYDTACRGYEKIGLSQDAARCSKHFMRLRNEIKAEGLPEPPLPTEDSNNPGEPRHVDSLEQNYPRPGGEIEPAPALQPSGELPDPGCASRPRKRSRSPSCPDDTQGPDAKKRKSTSSDS